MLTETEHSVVIDVLKMAKEKFTQGPLGHPWDHTEKVFNNAMLICRAEGGDEFLVCLAALLHDLGRIPEARGGLYRGRPVKSYGGHSMLSLWESREEIKNLRKNGLLNKEQCRELTFIIFWHSKLLRNHPRETKNLKILKDADMLDGVDGYDGILRDLLHSKMSGFPLWAPGLAVDFPKDRLLTISETHESGLGILQFAYSFRLLFVFESSKKLAKPKLALFENFLRLLQNEIRSGNIFDYDFWIGFAEWARNKGLNILTEDDLKKFKLSYL